MSLLTRKDFAPEVEPFEHGPSTHRPATPREGRVRWEPDTERFVHYEDGSWHEWSVTTAQVQAAAAAAFVWQDYTPALTGSVSDPALGTGGSVAAVGRHCTIGKKVDWHATVNAGAAGVTAGSGLYRISLPSVPLNSIISSIGAGLYADNSANQRAFIAVHVPGDQFFYLAQDGVATAAHLGSADPGLAANDAIYASGTYEIA